MGQGDVGTGWRVGRGSGRGRKERRRIRVKKKVEIEGMKVVGW